jgi:hypothetical protein
MKGVLARYPCIEPDYAPALELHRQLVRALSPVRAPPQRPAPPSNSMIDVHLEPGAKEGGAKANDGVDGHLGSEPRLVVDRGGEGPKQFSFRLYMRILRYAIVQRYPSALPAPTTRLATTTI